MSSSVRISWWLFGCCALVATMVMLGGITRVTGSGLSIVHWEPIHGAIPPLGSDAWQRAFADYRQSPEFRTVNSGMTLEQFRRIYLVEYAHRLLGRLTGLAVAVPFVVLGVRRRLTRKLAKRVGAAVGLIALQGAVGWWMVASGLVDVPHVSPFRLAAHLGMALSVFVLLLWTALDARDPLPAGSGLRRESRWPAAVASLVSLTALWGALVAGHRAGLAWNTFPLMNGQWIPDGLGALVPWWSNPIENAMTVQFTHRVLALTSVTAALGTWRVLRRRLPLRDARWSLDALAIAALVQLTLGISTLLLHVPATLAVLHQAGAVLLLGTAVTATHRLSRILED